MDALLMCVCPARTLESDVSCRWKRVIHPLLSRNSSLAAGLIRPAAEKCQASTFEAKRSVMPNAPDVFFMWPNELLTRPFSLQRRDEWFLTSSRQENKTPAGFYVLLLQQLIQRRFLTRVQLLGSADVDTKFTTRLNQHICVWWCKMCS